MIVFLGFLSVFCSIKVNNLRNLPPPVTILRQRLYERGFICKQIVFDAVTPPVYTTLIKTVGKQGRFKNAAKSVAIRFHLSCKRRNRMDFDTVTILARNLHCSIQMVNLARSAALAYTIKALIFSRKRFRVKNSKAHRF